MYAYYTCTVAKEMTCGSTVRRSSVYDTQKPELLPRARMREVGLSNRFCGPSVCQSSKFWADHDNDGSKHF